MIIKSMSRKQPSFGQLLSYIDRDAGQESYTIRHNVFGRSAEQIEAEFQTNSELMQKRKNGVYLFHEIVSLTRTQNLSAEEQKEKLRQIAQEYIAARCPGNMVYGGLHQDKDHSYHMHLCISANRVGEKKRQRLTKHQFRDIQVKLEAHVLQHYPELEQKLAIGKRSDRGRSKGEAELERRTGKRPKREEILQRIKTAYEASQDRDSLLSALGHENLELYIRGKTVGVIDHETGKKHRLKTLDLEMADQIEIRLSTQAEQLAEEPEQQSQRDEAQKSTERYPASQETELAGEKEKEGRRQEPPKVETPKSDFQQDMENIYAKKREKKARDKSKKLERKPRRR